jgi:hypothetical protein
MWEPRRLKTLWVSTVCYRDSFTFYPFLAFTHKNQISSLIILIIGKLSMKYIFDERNCLPRTLNMFQEIKEILQITISYLSLRFSSRYVSHLFTFSFLIKVCYVAHHKLLNDARDWISFFLRKSLLQQVRSRTSNRGTNSSWHILRFINF